MTTALARTNSWPSRWSSQRNSSPDMQRSMQHDGARGPVCSGHEQRAAVRSFLIEGPRPNLDTRAITIIL